MKSPPIPLLPSRKNDLLLISIDHHHASKSYTSGSPITGTLTVSPKRDTPFSSLSVSLIGLARVRRDDLDLPKVATHRFLRLDMPEAELVLPGNKIFRAGDAWTVPFTFVVPEGLTPGACTHRVDVAGVRALHARLPPSLGTWGNRDDMCVDSAKVEYAVQVDLVTDKGATIANKHVVNLLPYSPEDPPLEICPLNLQYTLRRDKKMRRSIVSPIVDGYLTAAARQPRAVNLEADGFAASGSTLHVSLAFEAKKPNVLPPRIGTASASVLAQTWSRQSPSLNLPDMGLLRDAYTNYTTVLTKAAVQTTGWQVDECGKAAAAAAGGGGLRYSASVQIPFELPTNKRLWTPTFHNCLISRTYKLALALEVGGSTVRLGVPVQVAMETLEYGFGDENGDGWTPEEVELLGGGMVSSGDACPEYEPSALRAVGVDVLPGYSA